MGISRRLLQHHPRSFVLSWIPTAMVLVMSASLQAGDIFESSDLAWMVNDCPVTSCDLDWEVCEGLSGRPTLLDNLGGLRTDLASQGVAVNLSTTQYYQGITSGGKEQTFQYGGRNDYLVKINGAQAGLWEGLIIDLHGETRYGEGTNGLTGGLSAPNPALLFPLPGETTTALTNVTFTQALSPSLLAVAGKINTLDVYAHPFAGGRGTTQFMNLSLIFPPILARTVPYSTLGLGVIALKGPEPVFSFFILDAAGEANRSGLEDPFGEGVTLLSQVSLPVMLADRRGHQQFEVAWTNRTFTALDQTNYLDNLGVPGVPLAEKSHSWALHYSFDQYLVVDPCDPTRGWGVFGQASLSDGDPNPIRWFVSAGIGGSSPIKSRTADTFGMGWYYMQISSTVKETLTGILPLGNETGGELYYNIAVTPWCHVTPNLQLIDPTNQTVDSAVLVGLRTKIDF